MLWLHIAVVELAFVVVLEAVVAVGSISKDVMAFTELIATVAFVIITMAVSDVSSAVAIVIITAIIVAVTAFVITTIVAVIAFGHTHLENDALDFREVVNHVHRDLEVVVRKRG